MSPEGKQKKHFPILIIQMDNNFNLIKIIPLW